MKQDSKQSTASMLLIPQSDDRRSSWLGDDMSPPLITFATIPEIRTQEPVQSRSYPQSIRQLDWQSQMQFVSLNTRGSRITRSLEPLRYSVSQFTTAATPTFSKTKKEEHFDRLTEWCKPTTQPPDTLESGVLWKKHKTEVDWTQMLRVSNQYDRLQPEVIDDPLMLREAVMPFGAGKIELRPDILRSSKHAIMGESSSSRASILTRMFCQGTSADMPVVVEDEEKGLNAEKAKQQPPQQVQPIWGRSPRRSEQDLPQEENMDSIQPLLDRLSNLPLAADSLLMEGLIHEKIDVHHHSPRLRLQAIQKASAKTSGKASRERPPEAPAPDTKEPQVVVVVADKLGSRLQRLHFGFQSPPRPKGGADTITIGIQVDEKSLDAGVIDLEPSLKVKPVKSITKTLIPQVSIDTGKHYGLNLCQSQEPTPTKKLLFTDEKFTSKSDVLSTKKTQIADLNLEKREEKKGIADEKIISKQLKPWQLVSRTEPHLVLPLLDTVFDKPCDIQEMKHIERIFPKEYRRFLASYNRYPPVPKDILTQQRTASALMRKRLDRHGFVVRGGLQQRGRRSLRQDEIVQLPYDLHNEPQENDTDTVDQENQGTLMLL